MITYEILKDMFEENGFPEVYTPDKCDTCKKDMEPMNDYISYSQPNTDSPQITVWHFCSLACLRSHMRI